MMKHTLPLTALGLTIMMSLAGDGPNRSSADEIPTQTLKLLQTFNDEFVAITPGEKDFPASFVMGSEKGPASEQPAHKVTIRYSFSIAKYEVPQTLYEAVMGGNPSKWKGPRNSAEMFSFRDAVEFCRKITALLREAKLLAADEEIRLPTEADEERFVKEAKARGMVGLKGHRSVGGIRVSTYNAVEPAWIDELVAFMREFARRG